MSEGNSAERTARFNKDVQSVLILAGCTIMFLAAGYFFGGKELVEAAAKTDAMQREQESAQQLIQQNSTRVTGIREELESIRGVFSTTERQGADVEVLRQRLTQIEESLSTLPRLASKTRTEMDAASSRNALQNAEHLAVISLADKCEQALLEMKTLTVLWDTKYQSLLTNDRGRMIAADQKAVEMIGTALRGTFPVVKDSIDGLAEFSAAVRPIREAATNGVVDYTVTPNDRDYFDSLLSTINDRIQQLQRRQRVVDTVLATTAEQDSGQLTLKQSIQQLESQIMLSAMEEVTRGRQQKVQVLIEAQSAAIFAAEEKRIAAETRLKVQQKIAATNDAIRKVEGLSKDEELAQAEDRARQLEKDFELDQKEIQRLLGTFMGKGRIVPATYFTLESPKMAMMPHAGSMPLGLLISVGALEPTMQGYESLYRIGGSNENRRPRSGFPSYGYIGMADPAIVARLKHASELLNKYGDLLVKKRMLAP